MTATLYGFAPIMLYITYFLVHTRTLYAGHPNLFPFSPPINPHFPFFSSPHPSSKFPLPFQSFHFSLTSFNHSICPFYPFSLCIAYLKYLDSSLFHPATSPSSLPIFHILALIFPSFCLPLESFHLLYTRFNLSILPPPPPIYSIFHIPAFDLSILLPLPPIIPSFFRLALRSFKSSISPF